MMSGELFEQEGGVNTFHESQKEEINHLMARGKPAKVAVIGKPPRDPQVLRDEQQEPPQQKEMRQSLFGMMEKEHQVEKEKSEKERTAQAEQQQSAVQPAVQEEIKTSSSIRGKPCIVKATKGKPPPVKRSLAEIDDLIEEKSRTVA